MITKMRKKYGVIQKSFFSRTTSQFNKTSHKSSLEEGISVSSNKGDSPSPRGDNSKKVKIL
jgi:hypothetical protein